MQEQLQLPGVPPPRPPGRDHLFLAIFPDRDTALLIARLVEQWRAKHGLRKRALASSRFHVTLLSLGIYSGLPPRLVRAACHLSSSVAAKTAPFETVFDRTGSFSGKPDRHPFVLRDHGGNAALRILQQRLCAKFGLLQNDGPAFTPHLTLLYDKRSIAEEPAQPVCWRVDEFVLIHSLQGQSRYIPLGRWKLCG